MAIYLISSFGGNVMKKTLGFLVAAGLLVSACTQTVYPENVLAGEALKARLTNTQLVLRPVSEAKPRKGAPTKFIVNMLLAGESTWEVNGSYPRKSLSAWTVRGNQVCLDDPNRRFYEERRRKAGQKVTKRAKNANCGVIAIKGDRVTMYPPQRAYGSKIVYTGTISKL